MIDFKEAKGNPSSSFSSPEEVLAATEFNDQQKIEILKSWAYDELDISVASDENMGGVSRDLDNDRLSPIIAALHKLGVSLDLEHHAHKQGGV